MSDNLHRLVYYSRNRIGGEAETPMSEIRTILAASQRNNAKAEVTGALMFNAGCFAQVLEGPQAAIEATFERIQQDERHGDVSLLAFEPVAARSFGAWSMGFVGARLDDADQFDSIASESGYDPSKMTGEHIFQVLQTLALEEESQAA
ncbi:MAG: BLUF domain-containing protein [Caulobacteraceae bacterium]